MQEHAFGNMLRTLRERREETQADVAEAVHVSRATIAQWEGGRHLPSPDRARSLDAHLDAEGALARLAAQERTSSSAPTPTDDPNALNLLRVFRLVRNALLDHLQRDEDGKPTGWCQDLQARNPPTPVSTAFGVKLAALVEESAKVELSPLGDKLREMELSTGGWAARTQDAPRPEAIAVVTDALVRIDPRTDVDDIVDLLASSLDDVARQRPHIISTVLETVLDLRPRSAFAAELLRLLLDSRRECNGTLLWVEKNEDDLVAPEPSVPHTARAVCALARAQSKKVVPADLAATTTDAMDAAVQWLLAQTRFDNTVEIVNRRTPNGDEVLYLRHFTAAWVVRALLMAGESAQHPTVMAAVRQTLDAFSEDHGLWKWRSGDLPIWMSFEAIAALRVAALAAFIR